MSVYTNQLNVAESLLSSYWLIVDTPGETQRATIAALAAYLSNVKTVNGQSPNAETGNVNLTTAHVSDTASVNKYVTAAQLTLIGLLTNSGDGTLFLSSDGTYKPAGGGGGGGGLWGTILGELSAQADLAAALAAKSPLLSPAFTGTPTAPTADGSTNTTQIATTAFVHAALAELIGGAPDALDTLFELAAALNDDADFASDVIAQLALKAPIASPAFTGLPVAPTAAMGTATTQLATTAFVQQEIDETVNDLGSVATGSTITLDGSRKNHRVVITGTGTFTLDYSGFVAGREYNLRIERTQNSSVTWAAGRWDMSGGTLQAPTLTNPTTNGIGTAVDVFVFKRFTSGERPFIAAYLDKQAL